MSEQAGRLSLDVEASTRGLGADIRRKVKAETSDITAKIKAEIDPRGLRTSIRAAVKEASTDAAAKIRLEVDQRGLKAAVKEAARAASTTTIKLAIEVQSRGLNAQVRAIAAEASKAAKIRLDVDTSAVDRARAATPSGGGGSSSSASPSGSTVTARVEADTRLADAEIDRLRQRQERKPIDVKVKTSSKGLDGLDAKLLSFGGGITKGVGLVGIIGSAIGPILSLVGGLGQVGAGLVAIVSYASQAAGAIGAIPGALSIAAQVVGVVKTAFSGIGAAIKASDAQNATGAKQSVDLAAQRAASARRISDAQKSVARAQEEVGLTAASGALAVSQAERRIVDAQAASKRAQEDLTKARDDAREHLEDLRLTLQGAALDEESAQLAVERALQRRTESLNSPLTSSLDKREADLAYREALQHLAEVKEANGDLRKQAVDDVKKGVEGADTVVAAQDQVKQSVQDEADARAELGRTVADAARANRDAADRVISAQRDLADAVADAGRKQDATAASTSAYGKAMDGLSPAGQRLVKFLTGTYIPAWKNVKTAVQEALLPSVQSGLQTTLKLIDPVKTVAVATATALGKVFTLFADTITTPQWIADIKTLGTNNATVIETLGTALVNLLTPIKDLAVVSNDGPDSLIGRFAAWTKGLSENTSAAIGAARANGSLKTFFDNAGDTIAQFARIIGNITTGIFNIGKSAAPAGKSLTDSFEAATKRFADFTKNNAGQIKTFFDNLVPVVTTFGDIVVEVAKILGDIMSDPTTLQVMKDIRDKVVPALGRLIDAFQNSGTGEKFVQIISDLLDIVTNLVNSGALGSFTDELGVIVGWLKDFTADPGNAELFKNLFQLAAIVGPLALAAGAVLKIAGGLGSIGKATGAASVLKSLGGLIKGGVGKGASGVGDLLGGLGRGGSSGGSGSGSGRGGRSGSGSGGGRAGAAGAAGSAAEDLLNDFLNGGSGSFGGGALDRHGIGNHVADPTAGPAVRDPRFRVPSGGSGGGGGGGYSSQDQADLVAQLIANGINPEDALSAAGDALSNRGDGSSSTHSTRTTTRGGADTTDTRGRGTKVKDKVKSIAGSETGKAVGGALGGAALGAVGGLITQFDKGDNSLQSNIAKYIGNIAAGAGAGFTVGGPIGAAIGAVGGAAKAAFEKGFATKGLAGGIDTVLTTLTTGPIGYFKDEITTKAVEIGGVISDKFKEIVGGAILNGSLVIGGFVKGVGDKLGKFKDTVGSFFYDNFVKPFKDFFGIKSPSTLMAGFGGNVVDGFLNGVAVLGVKFAAFITGLPPTLLAAFTSVKTWVTARAGEWRDNAVSTVTQIGGKIATAVTGFPGVIAASFSTLRNYFATRLGELTGIAGTAMLNVSNKIQEFLNRFPSAFGTAVNLITATWNGLKSAAATPVRFVIDTVYNNGLRAVWNKVIDIAKIPGVGQLPAISANFAKGGVVPGYTPGRDPYITSGPTGNVALSGGEGILVPEAVRGIARSLRMTTGSAIDYINSQFTQRVNSRNSGTGGARFATGGVYDGSAPGGSGSQQTSNGSLIRGAPGSASANAAVNFALRQAAAGTTGWLNRCLAFVNAAWGHTIPWLGTPRAIDAWRAAPNKHTDTSPPAGAAIFYTTGNPAGHVDLGLGGNAIASTDLPTRDRIGLVNFNTPMSQWGARYLGWSMPDGSSGGSGFLGNIASSIGGFIGGIKDRALGLLDPVTKSIGSLSGTGFSGLAKGVGQGLLDGLLRRLTGFDSGLFDNGGVFPSGTIGRNQSGRPEVVFTEPQWSTLSRIAAAGLGMGPGAGAAAGVPTYGTYFAEGAIQTTVINPVGETTDTSINARMRSLSDLGLFENAGAA